MPNIFHEEVSIVFCQIYYFWRETEDKVKIESCSFWVNDDKVVKCSKPQFQQLKGYSSNYLVRAMEKDGYQLGDVI